MEYASVSLENQDRAKALEDRIGEFSAQAHATLAEVAKPARSSRPSVGGAAAASGLSSTG